MGQILHGSANTLPPQPENHIPMMFHNQADKLFLAGRTIESSMATVANTIR